MWSTPTLDPNDGSFISGAPRVFNDKVAIGFGDSGVVRGAVGVYDAATGNRLWRWEAPARWRRGLERDHLRPGDQSAVRGHRQRARPRCDGESPRVFGGGA